MTENKKMPKWLRIILIILAVIFGIATVAAIILYEKWERADYLTTDMFQATSSADIPVYKVNEINDNSSGDTENADFGDVISYKGKKYRYNDNLINVLILGVDNKGEYDNDSDITAPYQSDTLILGTIDAVNKKVTFLNIPRDTVTKIQVLDLNDEVAATEWGPIAIQHSGGTQGEKTNEVTADTVSNLLYGVPIYRYVTIDLTAIPELNDSVGGVTVEVLEDLTQWDKSMEKGATVTLKGDAAITYLCRRDVNVDDSPIGRMQRQAQYLRLLFPAVKKKTMEDVTFPVQLYQHLSDKIATNLTIDEITYLAKQLRDLELDTDTIATIPGTMREIQEGEYEGYLYKMGYVVDEDALKQMIIDRFYVPAE